MTDAPTSNDLSLPDTLELTRHRFAVLLRTIVAGSYFDALFAAARFRTVLEHLEHLVRTLPDDQQAGASRCLADIRAIAAPVLELALVPEYGEPPEPLAQEDMQARWRRAVLGACISRRAELDVHKWTRHCAPESIE